MDVCTVVFVCLRKHWQTEQPIGRCTGSSDAQLRNADASHKGHVEVDRMGIARGLLEKVPVFLRAEAIVGGGEAQAHQAEIASGSQESTSSHVYKGFWV